MDRHIFDFFHQSSNNGGNHMPITSFYKVIALHDGPDIDLSFFQKLCPHVCKGWFELAQLPIQDRVEFLQDFWLNKMVHYPKLNEFLVHFFSHLDDVGVFITQKHFDDPFQCQIVYSLKEQKGFFRGLPPATEEELVELQRDFSEVILPADYLAFLEIHNGFFKTTDIGGITPSSLMYKQYSQFQKVLQNRETVVSGSNATVDPKTLIPFYESFGMPFYQCFWSEWYPEQEMGNVYYSATSHNISNVASSAPSNETLAFPTFSEWLIFYMETID